VEVGWQLHALDEAARWQQLLMAADALDANEIAGAEVFEPGGGEGFDDAHENEE
jgi:hypothetical protein